MVVDQIPHQVLPRMGKTPATTRRPLSKLKRWEQNYRVGDIRAIIGSIVRFGFNGALRIWSDGTVKAGNGALIALETMKANGANPPHGITVQGREWMVPVIDISHLNRTEAKAFGVADNRTHDLGTDDEERLAEILTEIGTADSGIVQAAGFSDADLKALLERVDRQHRSDSTIPDAEDPDAADFGLIRPQLGQTWRLGDHLLVCGDATDQDRRVAAVGGQKPALCLSDPPYAVNFENIRRKPGERTTKQRGEPYRDPKKARPLLDVLFAEPKADLLLFSFPLAKHFQELAGAADGWEMLYELVWVKHHFAYIAWRRYQQKHEIVFVFRRDGAKGHFNVPKNQSTVFEIPKSTQNLDHPTQKPIDLWKSMIEFHSAPGDLVFDPFVGSGTTLVCAEQLSRRCVAIEIEPRYCEVVLRRWEEMTGQKAALET